MSLLEPANAAALGALNRKHLKEARMAVYNKIAFSIVLADGQRYAANNIQHHFRGNHEDVVSFICSGTVMTFSAKEIATIEIGRSNQFCDHCDQRYPDNWIWDAMPEPAQA